MGSPYNKPLTKTGIEYREIKDALFDTLGHECKECGFNDRRALQIDHIYGGGEKHRKKYGGTSTSYYRDMLRDPQLKNKYQILCANHNFIKMRETAEYRRKSWSYRTGTGKEATSPSQESSIRQLTLSI